MNDGITKTDVIEFFNNSPSELNSRLVVVIEKLNELIKPNMLVLDVGCGIGITSRNMAELGAKVIAIDIAPKLIECAKRKSFHENITYLTEDINEYITEHKFDLIVMADVLEHLIPDQVQNTIIRFLDHNTHKDTVVYLNVPDRNFIHFMEHNYLTKLQIVDKGYSIGEITDLFSCCGFVPEHIKIYGIDTAVQYNEYVFIKRNKLEDHYREKLGKIYNRRGK